MLPRKLSVFTISGRSWPREAAWKTRCAEIYRSEWTRQGSILTYDVEGSGFLYNMVRILVGTMLDIAKGTLPETGDACGVM